jgi:hypothetical protein
MNDNLIASLFDSSDDDLSRSIDRFADGECSAAEEAELFNRLDATPGTWKQCALALAEVRDLRISLAGVGRSEATEDDSIASVRVGDKTVALASSLNEQQGGSLPAKRRQIVPWSAVALGLALAFAAGFAVAPREAPQVSSPENGSLRQPDPEENGQREAVDRPRSNTTEGDLIASDSPPTPNASSASGPEIVNVVYRPSGAAEESSAPLPVYKSDEAWARALDVVMRQSDADLAERRVQLLVQGADLERQVVLHSVATEQGEMLLPVETFQIVPVSLDTFH